MNLHKDKKVLEELIEAAAGYTGFSFQIIEKDYYVTEILKSVCNKQNNIVFKGGTCLSKCFKLINRFSEDIDVNISEENQTVGVKKHLKQNIVSAVEELGLAINNIEETRSRRDYNLYKIPYESLYPFKTEVEPIVKFESVLKIGAFPYKRMNVSSYIYDYLKEINRDDLISYYSLEPFEVDVQSLERTFVDKVFALCDYSISGKILKHSRHIYDLKQIYPHIEMNESVRNLVCEIRELRKEFDSCYSAKEGMNINELLQNIIDKKIYKKDYESITYELLLDKVSYEESITVIKKIIDDGLFV